MHDNGYHLKHLMLHRDLAALCDDAERRYAHARALRELRAARRRALRVRLAAALHALARRLEPAAPRATTDADLPLR